MTHRSPRNPLKKKSKKLEKANGAWFKSSSSVAHWFLKFFLLQLEVSLLDFGVSVPACYSISDTLLQDTLWLSKILTIGLFCVEPSSSGSRNSPDLH